MKHHCGNKRKSKIPFLLWSSMSVIACMVIANKAYISLLNEYDFLQKEREKKHTESIHAGGRPQVFRCLSPWCWKPVDQHLNFQSTIHFIVWVLCCQETHPQFLPVWWLHVVRLVTEHLSIFVNGFQCVSFHIQRSKDSYEKYIKEIKTTKLKQIEDIKIKLRDLEVINL